MLYLHDNPAVFFNAFIMVQIMPMTRTTLLSKTASFVQTQVKSNLSISILKYFPIYFI